MTRETLEAQLLRLPAEERAHLARVLIESLDEQPALDPAWLEEAERRAAELVSGTVQPIPATEALAKARRRLAG
jgi:putative addiction module component (TIGR02574 family)